MNAVYPYMNEDVAFERLKDLQREMENSRLTAGALGGFGRAVRNLPAGAWSMAGLAIRRVPRRRPASPSA
ncbi:MAG TPA: hypothetical protein VG009_08195 [Candidatus Dormibacteraeota bacterium]|nr:hypothetical protein [Candidatus Dormibacteraeota bacterium]